MKLSLRTKLMAVLVAAPALLFLMAMGTVWMLDYRQRVAQQGGVFRGEAVQVARSLQLAVERCIGNLQDLLSLGDVAELLKSESDSGADLASEAWKTRTRQIDSVWPSLRLDSPQVQVVLNNPLAARLRAFGRNNWIFSEIIVADRVGRLVAATSRPSNYDQSNEAWWSQGMRLSRGEAVLEGFTFDESAGVLALNIALPIVPEASGSAVGVLKAVVNVSTLLASVTVLSTATEAQAEVIGRDGVILLQLSDKSYVPSGAKISTRAASQLKPDAGGWFIAPLSSKDMSMVGFASVRLLGTFSLDQQIHGDPLYVIVHSPASIILAPLRERAAAMGIAGVSIILLCSGLVAYFAQKTILSPLRTLSNAADAMAATVLARKNARPGKKILPPETALAEVEAIKTGDEI